MNGSKLGVFGSRTRSDVLISVFLLKETHARELERLLGVTYSSIDNALASLETAGLIVGTMEGTSKRFRLNPRFAALAELESLLGSLATHDTQLIARLSEARRRPRKQDKEL